MAGKQDVFTSLGHRTIRRADHKNSTVHLGGTGDHVLNKIGVTRAVDVGVMTLCRLILHMANGDRNGFCFVTNRAPLGNVRIAFGYG